MPRDAKNMPYARSASFRNDEPKGTLTASDNMDTSLKLENILLEEFNYASLTAYQAMEDRARISSLYYVLIGAVASALAAVYQLGGTIRGLSQSILMAMLFIAGVISFTFFVKIIRLRQAYRESLICMNVIKEFYISQFQPQFPQIRHVFRWRLDTIPAGERFGSVTFVISSLIAFVGSLCFAAATFLAIEPRLLANGGPILPLHLGMAIVIGFIVLLLYILFYRHALSKRSEKAILEKQEHDLNVSLSVTHHEDSKFPASNDGDISLSTNQ